MKLDHNQRAVINSPPSGRILVEAGPGTGKTEVVARRLAWMLSDGGVKPSQILVLSFSRAAVKALVSRIRVVDVPDSILEEMRHVSIRTFDSWSFRMLRFLGENPFDLLRNTHNDNIKKMVNRLAELNSPEQLPEGTRLAKIRHIVIDEFQDLTGVRAQLVQQLLRVTVSPTDKMTETGFTLLGDPHQAIYEWTRDDRTVGGLSSKELIAWVKETYGQILAKKPLTKNHRATSDLSHLVSDMAHRLTKVEAAGGDPLSAVSELIHEKLDTDCVSDVVLHLGHTPDCGVGILCRSNSQVIDVGLKLRTEIERDSHPGMNCMLDICAGDSPKILPVWIASMLYRYTSAHLSRAQFKKIFSLCLNERRFDLPCSGDSEEAWKLLLRAAQKGEGETSITMDELRERISWPDSLPDDEGYDHPHVTVTTIHKSKGLEFDLVRVVEGVPGERDTDGCEEARVLFVGLSRAKKDLALLGNDNSLQFSCHLLKTGRKRWQNWSRTASGAHHHLEIGMDGDVDAASFVSTAIHGDAAGVESLQNFLGSHSNDLPGKQVELHFHYDGPRSVSYTIHLPEFDNLTLGVLTSNVSLDIHAVKHKDQKFPQKIYGLRVNSISTIVGKNILGDVPEPWSKSRLWLGADIHGIASFSTFWRN